MYSVWSIHVPLYDEIGGLKYFQFLVLTCITLSLAKLFVFHRIPWMHGMDYSCTFMLLLVRFDINDPISLVKLLKEVEFHREWVRSLLTHTFLQHVLSGTVDMEMNLLAIGIAFSVPHLL
jgi:hypothetical protein